MAHSLRRSVPASIYGITQAPARPDTVEDETVVSRMSHHRIVGIDFLVIAWVLLCLMLGVGATKRINHIGALGDGLVSAGDSVSGVGGAIAGLEDTPLVGGAFGAVADKIDALGGATAQQGRNGKEAIWKAALGIGILITLLPTLPLLAIWIPIRVSIERERASLRASLKANEPGVWEFLALQAVDDMSFKDLRKISADPWEDIRQGRYEALAQVEIDRLGLTLAAGEQPTRTPISPASTQDQDPPPVA